MTDRPRDNRFFYNPGLNQITFGNMDGGLDATNSDIDAAPRDMTNGQNIVNGSSTSKKKRDGSTLYGPFLGTATGILGGFNFVNNSGTQVQMVVYDTKLKNHTSSASTDYAGITFTTNKVADGCFFSNTNKFYITNKTDTVVKVTDGTTVDQSDTNFKKGKYIVAFKDHLLTLNLTNQEDYCWYTDTGLDTFGANNYFRIGGVGTGIEVLKDDKVLLFTNRKVKRLMNFTFDGTGTFPSQLDTLPADFGAIYDRTIQVVNNLCYFVGQDTDGIAEIYVTDGYTVVPIGDPKIRRILDGLSAAQLGNACAVADANNYRLHIAESGSSTNNIGIIYDTVNKHYLTVERRFIVGRSDFSCLWSTETDGQWDIYAGTGGTGQVYKLHANDGLYDELGEERYLTSGAYNVPIDANPAKRAAQGFQMSQYNTTQTVPVTQVALQLKKNAGTTTGLTVRIETDNNGKPSGTLVSATATTTINAFTSTSYAWYMGIFSSVVNLTGSTTYWLVVRHTTEGSGNSQYHWLGDACTPTYAYGNLALFFGTTGALTTTFNPDGNPESTSVDGHVVRSLDPDIVPTESFSTIRSGAGNFAFDGGSNTSADLLADAVTSNTYIELNRALLLFDTSSLPNDAVISAATLSIYVTYRINELSQSLNVTSGTPASNTALVTSDYAIANFGSTTFSTNVDMGTMTLNAYNAFILNGSGIAVISLTGITKLAVRGSGDITNTAPTWVADGLSKVSFQTAENTNKPKLVITYTSASSEAAWTADPMTDQNFAIYAQSPIDAYFDTYANLAADGREFQMRRFQTIFSTVGDYNAEVGFSAGEFSSFDNYLVDLSVESGVAYGDDDAIYGSGVEYGGVQTRNYDWTDVDSFEGRTLKQRVRNRNANQQIEWNRTIVEISQRISQT